MLEIGVRVRGTASPENLKSERNLPTDIDALESSIVG